MTVYFWQEFRERKRLRLKGYDYSLNGLYHATICTMNREYIFGDVITGEMHLSTMGEIAYEELTLIPKRVPYAILDEFVVMPNHIHVIIQIDNPNHARAIHRTGGHMTARTMDGAPMVWEHPEIDPTELQPQPHSLSTIVRNFKGGVTMRARKNNLGTDIWHRSFYDQIIRNDRALENIRAYIRNNPAKWEFDRNNQSGLYM